MKRLIPLLVLAASVVLAGPAHAAPADGPTKIRLSALDRGPDPGVAYVRDGVLVDGSLRIPLRGRYQQLLSTSTDGYVVQEQRGQGSNVVLLAADGSRTELGRPSQPVSSAVVSADGTTVALALSNLRATATRVIAYDADTGERRGKVRLPGYRDVLDTDGTLVVIGGFDTEFVGTATWDLASGRVRTISGRPGYAADVTADLLATYTKDPYDGGCTLLTRLSKPGQRIWRSCTERIDSFSPDDSRMATIDMLADGIGPTSVRVRTTTGAQPRTYDAPSYFGVFTWEGRRLLAETYAAKRHALVRLAPRGVELASRIERGSGLG